MNERVWGGAGEWGGMFIGMQQSLAKQDHGVDQIINCEGHWNIFNENLAFQKQNYAQMKEEKK